MRIVRRLLAAALLAFCAACHADAQETPVVLDGVFGEWSQVQPIVEDPADAPAPYADVRAVRVRNDRDFAYVMLTLEREVSVQGLPGTLAMLLDADGDPRTGSPLYGVAGVEAAVEFSPEVEGRGRGGVMLRMADSAGAAPRLRSAYDAGVVSMPTHASRQFEIRIRRDGAVRMGPRVRIQLLSMDAAGAVVDTVQGLVFGLSTGAAPPASRGAGAADPLARPPGTDLRVVSWNVGREDLFLRPDAFGAVLRALAPDLLMLDEVAGGHSADEVEALLNRVVPGDRPWRVVYGVSGGSQRGVIATRGSAPRLVAPFDAPIPYPDSTRGIITPGSGEGRWLRSRLEAHVPATGALVEIGGHTLFGVTVDLEAGGAPGSSRDRLRRIEALAIRESTERVLFSMIRDVSLRGVLITGDVNLVGTADPLELLVQPMPDGPPLAVAFPLRLDGTSAATWENPAEPFTPGRLDFVLYHPAFTAVTGGFVFSSADLSPAWLARHGLQAETSRATDHLPIVTDLRWLRLEP